MFGIEFLGGESMPPEEINKIKKFTDKVMAAIKGTVAEEYMQLATQYGPHATVLAATTITHAIMDGYAANHTEQQVAVDIVTHIQAAKDLAMLDAMPDDLPMH